MEIFLARCRLIAESGAAWPRVKAPGRRTLNVFESMRENRLAFHPAEFTSQGVDRFKTEYERVYRRSVEDPSVSGLGCE